VTRVVQKGRKTNNLPVSIKILGRKAKIRLQHVSGPANDSVEELAGDVHHPK